MTTAASSRVVHIPVKEPTDRGAHATRDFRKTPDGYEYTFLELGLVFQLDRLHRDSRGDLVGELAVKCGTLHGARTMNGYLVVTTFNITSSQSRFGLARDLANRAQTQEIRWRDLVEDFAILVLAAERDGDPSVNLRELPPPGPDEHVELVGLTIPFDHPSLVFADGDTGKSMWLLAALGELSQRHEVSVGLIDYETDQDTQRRRLALLFGDNNLPTVHYLRGERPLIYEVDRVKRMKREHGIEFFGIDSAGFATDGKPEDAVSALSYFRALRQIGGGSVSLAHVVKAGEHAEWRPFGSAFWHNSSRCTWFLKRAATSPDGSTHTIGAFNRKYNVGRALPAVGLELSFNGARAEFRKTEIAAVDELAVKLPLWQRIRHELRGGPLTIAALSEGLAEKEDSIKKALQRNGGLFTKVLGSHGVPTRFALVERREP